MKLVNKLIPSLLPIIALTILSGCAAGAATAATAGYSLKSQSADSLSSEAEQRIIERVKKELRAEVAQQT